MRTILSALLLVLLLSGCAGQLEQFAAADFRAAASRGIDAQAAQLLPLDDAYVTCAKEAAGRLEKLASALSGERAGIVDAAMALHIRAEQLRQLSPQCARVILEIETLAAKPFGVR